MSDALHSRRDIAAYNSGIRQRVSALPTYSVEAARAAHARPITHAFQTRIIDQCVMLLRVVNDFKERRIYLVKKEKSAIEVWAAPTQTKHIEPLPLAKEEEPTPVPMDPDFYRIFLGQGRYFWETAA
jgi:hypothetical protein